MSDKKKTVKRKARPKPIYSAHWVAAHLRGYAALLDALNLVHGTRPRGMFASGNLRQAADDVERNGVNRAEV